MSTRTRQPTPVQAIDPRLLTMSIEKPIAGALDVTSCNFLKHDGPAGIVTFLVALPLCLGIALGSAAPMFADVIAGIVGGMVVSLLSGLQDRPPVASLIAVQRSTKISLIVAL
jgi:MFS superfamily sulfate permease-like transporter